MDLRRTVEEKDFRAEVVAFLASHLPDSLRMRTDGAQLSTREETLGWQKILFAKGWGAPHWPSEHGGTGWTPPQRLIFDIECAKAGVPWTNQQGMSLLGPVVSRFGTAEQRARLVGPLLRGETYWCQGFSEPEAGSDLAAVKTTAHRSGDHYRISGQKIWTSHAEHADWIFLLVRTAKAPKKQEGLSFLVAPIETPGITVHAIDSIDGLTHLTEVFLDDVAVPHDNLIGEEGQGWEIAKHLLGKERIFGACDLPGMLRELGRLKRAMLRPSRSGRAPLDDAAAAHRLALLDMEAEVVTMAFLHAISGDRQGGLSDVALASVLKVRVTEIHQHIVEFLYDVLEDRAPLFYPDPMGREYPSSIDGISADLSKVSSEIMYRRASSIYGGTNEIQREIIAKSVISG
jgi:acyl-CoA dehydrogenase